MKNKTHQITIIVVALILLIGILDFMIFRPARLKFEEAQTGFQSTSSQLGTIKKPSDPKAIDDYSSETTRFMDQLTSGIKSLDLEIPEDYVMNLKEETLQKLTIPAETPKDKEVALREEIYQRSIKPQVDKQIDLLMKEVVRLMELNRKQDTLPVKLSFMSAQYIGQAPYQQPYGWGIPTQLPDNMQSGYLWDHLKQIAENKGTLDQFASDANASLGQIQIAYMNGLFQLGMDPKRVTFLASKGEFVPLLYRLCFAQLILEKMDRPVILSTKQLDRDYLFHLLNIKIPTDHLIGAHENRLFFFYQQLRSLNDLLEMAQNSKLKDINDVVLRAYGMLRVQDKLSPLVVKGAPPTFQSIISSDDDLMMEKNVVVAAAASGDMVSEEDMMMMDEEMDEAAMEEANLRMEAERLRSDAMAAAASSMQGNEAKPIDGKPKTDEIGYGLLIRISFIADNTNAWSFLYSVLRDKPLAELDRLMINSQSRMNPNLQDLEVTSSFIFVPKMFETMDTVRGLIKQLEEDSAGAAGANQTAAAE